MGFCGHRSNTLVFIAILSQNHSTALPPARPSIRIGCDGEKSILFSAKKLVLIWARVEIGSIRPVRLRSPRPIRLRSGQALLGAGSASSAKDSLIGFVWVCFFIALSRIFFIILCSKKLYVHFLAPGKLALFWVCLDRGPEPDYCHNSL